MRESMGISRSVAPGYFPVLLRGGSGRASVHLPERAFSNRDPRFVAMRRLMKCKNVGEGRKCVAQQIKAVPGFPCVTLSATAGRHGQRRPSSFGFNNVGVSTLR